MNLDKIQMEQADALRQEKIINDFIKKHPHLFKASKPKKRDILSEAEYNHSDGRRLQRESPKTES